MELESGHSVGAMSGNENMEEPVLVPEPQEENEEFRRMVQRIAGESFAIQDNQREVSNGSNNNNNSSDIQVVGVVSRYVPGHFVPPSVMAFLQRLGQDFRQQIEAARAEQEARNDYLVKEQVECVKYAMSLEQDAKIRGLQQQIDILFEKRQQDIREKNELTAKVEALAKVVEELKKKLDTDVEKENNTKEKEPEDNVPSLSEQVIIDQCEDQKPKNDLERPLPVHQENEPAPADDFPDEGHGFSPLIGSISSSQPEKPLTKAKTVRKKRSGNESRSKVRVVKPRNRSLEIKKKAKACRSNSNAPASTQFPCVVPNCSFIGRTLISLKRHQGVHERRRHACKDCTR